MKGDGENGYWYAGVDRHFTDCISIFVLGYFKMAGQKGDAGLVIDYDCDGDVCMEGAG